MARLSPDLLRRIDAYWRADLFADAVDRVPALASRAAHVTQWVRDKLTEHREYITTHGEDLPEIRNWRWALRT